MEIFTTGNCKFLSVEQIRALNASNIKTFLDFLSAPSEDVSSILEITEFDYSTVRISVLQCVQPQPLSLLELSSIDRLTPKSTGMSSLDKMLGGGLFPGDIIEVYGETGSGKTQICLHLTAQFCHFNEPNSYVIYFDMKCDFNAVRLKMLCDDKIDNLGKVKIFREPNLEGLFARLDEMKNHLVGGINGFYSRTKFIVVNSVPMCIYPAVTQDSYSWRYYPEQLVSRLKWLAENRNMVIILVNHAVTIRNPVGLSGSSRKGTSTTGHIKAAMGKFWHHNMHTRIQLCRVNGSCNLFSAKLEKSGRTSEGQQFQFSINRDAKLEEVQSLKV